MNKGIKTGIMSLTLIALLLHGLTGSSAAGSFLDERVTDITDTSNVRIMFEKEAFTQEDLNDNFENYAEATAKTSFPTIYSEKENETVNVVGVVLDREDKMPIEGATISVNGDTIVSTGTDGRFQIENMPEGKYTWLISANNYFDAQYQNYTICHEEGAHIYTFYIDDEKSITKNRDALKNGTQVIPYDTMEMTTTEPMELHATASLTAVPTISDTVRIKYDGDVIDIDRETYLYGVVAIENFPANFYTTRGMSNTEVWQLYCAQAIASNTLIEYAQHVYSNHGNAYDLCSTSCCQAYDPTQISQAVITAVGDIFYTVSGEPAAVVLFYEPDSNTYEYFWSAFGSSCYGQGTRDRSNTPALRGVECTDFAQGYGGERFGLCQMGAAYLANQGYNASQILMYYYTDCDTEFCVIE